jgi:hypothetical protein
MQSNFGCIFSCLVRKIIKFIYSDSLVFFLQNGMFKFRIVIRVPISARRKGGAEGQKGGKKAASRVKKAAKKAAWLKMC